MKEDYVNYFNHEIDGDNKRIESLKKFKDGVTAKIIKEQIDYLRFEKNYFNELEQLLKDKKQKSRM